MNEPIEHISGNSDFSKRQFSKNREPVRSLPEPEADNRKGSHKYVIESNLIMYELYDCHGKLISRVPWPHRPIDREA